MARGLKVANRTGKPTVGSRTGRRLGPRSTFTVASSKHSSSASAIRYCPPTSRAPCALDVGCGKIPSFRKLLESDNGRSSYQGALRAVRSPSPALNVRTRHRVVPFTLEATARKPG